MFTGIIKNIGEIIDITSDKSNKTYTIKSSISDTLTIDQSVAHNGVCLTVEYQNKEYHIVTAIKETLEKSNFNDLKIGHFLNLETCMKMNDMLDGHIVQGHVDDTAICTKIENIGGSYNFHFKYISDNITVNKGSICVNGASLTVCNSQDNSFYVSIIPYTYENTVFKYLKVGDKVNLEFDIIGKYISKLFEKY